MTDELKLNDFPVKKNAHSYPVEFQKKIVSQIKKFGDKARLAKKHCINTNSITLWCKKYAPNKLTKASVPEGQVTFKQYILFTKNNKGEIARANFNSAERLDSVIKTTDMGQYKEVAIYKKMVLKATTQYTLED